MGAVYTCPKCGKWQIFERGDPAIACDCSRAEAWTIARGAISAGPSVPGDSRQRKSSDDFAWLDTYDEDTIITLRTGRTLLEIVRRLERENTASLMEK